MRFLSLAEVLALQQRLIATSGGADGLRDAGALESAVSQPHARQVWPPSSRQL